MDAIFGSSAEAATADASGGEAAEAGAEVDVEAILNGLAAANK